MNPFELISSIWQQWILLSLPGAILLYLLAELLLRYGQQLSARLRYWLFIGVLIKCMLPPLLWIPLPVLEPKPEAVVSSMPAASHSNQTFALSDKSVILMQDVPAIESQPEAVWWMISWLEGLFLAQLIGTGFIFYFLFYKIIHHIRHRQPLRDEDTDALCGRLCIRLNMPMPRLYVSPDGLGACAGGLISPYIVLPKTLLMDDEEQQRLVLMHELIHIQRRDQVVNWLQVAVFAVFWWHPIIWRMNYVIRCEREHCCDERVVKELAIAPIEYSKLLVDAAEKQILHNQFHWQTAFANPAHAFNQRIRRIITMNHTTKKYKWIGVSLTVCLIAGITFGFQFVQAQSQKENITKAVNQLESMKSLLQIMQENNVEVPKEILDSLDTSLQSLFQTVQKKYTPEELAAFKFTTKNIRPAVMKKNLDKVISGGVRFENITLQEAVNSIKEKIDAKILLSGNVQDKKVNLVMDGDPTLKEVLDSILPDIGLGYIENKQRFVIIDEKEKIKPSSFDIEITDGVTVNQIPFGELIKQIQEKTGVQIRLGEGIAELPVTVKQPDATTVGSVISSAMSSISGNTKLGHTESYDGVIYIDTEDRIGGYNVGRFFATSAIIVSHSTPSGVMINEDGTLVKMYTSTQQQPSGFTEMPPLYEKILDAYYANDNDALNRYLDEELDKQQADNEAVLRTLTEEDAQKQRQQRSERMAKFSREQLRQHQLDFLLKSGFVHKYKNKSIPNVLDKYTTMQSSQSGQPLTNFLDLYGNFMGVKFVMPDDLAWQKVTYSVTADLTLRETLDAVLPDAGLVYKESEDGVIHIFKKEK